MDNKQPRKHHFIPVSILSRFASNDGKLWVYNKDTDEFFSSTPESIGYENNLNTFIDENGIKNTDIENPLLSRIDSDVKPVIDKIESWKDDTTVVDFSSLDKAKLMFFLGFQIVRVPSFHEWAGNYIGSITKELGKVLLSDPIYVRDQFEKMGIRDHDITPESIVEYVKTGKYSVKPGKGITLEACIDLGSRFSFYLSSLDIEVVKSHQESSFITSDNPFVVLPPVNSQFPRRVGFLTKGTKKVIPVSPNTCILLGDYGNKLSYSKVDRVLGRSINVVVGMFSKKQIYSRDERLLRRVVEIMKNKELLRLVDEK